MTVTAVARLPESEEVARSFMRPIWHLTSLPEAMALWRTLGARPRCGSCDVRTCTSPTTATSRYCVGHQRRRDR